MRISFVTLAAAFALACPLPAIAQSSSATAIAAPEAAPARTELAARPWEYGPFFQGGEGVGYRFGYTFTSAGFHLGKVITGEHLGGIFRGQFEYAGELMPYWQAFTPAPHQQPAICRDPATGLTYPCSVPYGGGTYTGFSLTPIILRWDFKAGRRFAPYFQAAGGLIYTTHKFPPDVLVVHGQPGGTSVFNFSPQGGFGINYFLRPGRSIYVSGSGIHISSASLGDKNPGVNASVQFQIGYTWWSR